MPSNRRTEPPRYLSRAHFLRSCTDPCRRRNRVFHFQDERHVNRAFQLAQRWRVEGDHDELHGLLGRLAPELDELTRMGLALYMALFYAENPNPPEPKRTAKTQRDREIQHKAVVLGHTTSQLAIEYGLSPTRIREILNMDCEAVGRGPGTRWEYTDPDELWEAKRKVAIHNRIYNAGKLPQCPYVALPEGRMDRLTISRVLDDLPTLLRLRERGRARRTGHMAVANVDGGSVVGSVGLGKGSKGSPLMGALLSVFLKHKVTVSKVNGYPAFVWENGMHVFFHEFNWLVAHGLWAKPYDGERTNIHHIDGDPCNCRPRNLVLLTEREHWALHSDKRRKAREKARQGVGKERRK